MKFLFNLQTLTLKITQENHFLVLSEPFYTLGGVGFILDHSEPPNCWIIFKVYQEKVRVVYKNAEIYYQRELTRPASEVVEVEFSEWDQIEKKNKKY